MLKHSRGSEQDALGIFLTASSITELLDGALGGGSIAPLATQPTGFVSLPPATVDAVQRVLRNLSEREQQVVRMRYGIGTRLHSVDETSARLGMIPVQIARIEVRAFRKLREASIVGDGLEPLVPQPDPCHGDNRRPTAPADPRRLPEDPEREANPWDEV